MKVALAVAVVWMATCSAPTAGYIFYEAKTHVPNALIILLSQSMCLDRKLKPPLGGRWLFQARCIKSKNSQQKTQTCSDSVTTPACSALDESGLLSLRFETQTSQRQLLVSTFTEKALFGFQKRHNHGNGGSLL